MNKQLILCILSGVFGFSIGSLCCMKFLNSYYEDISSIEIEKAREYYKDKTIQLPNLESVEQATRELARSAEEAEKIIINNGYNDPFKDILDEEEDEDTENNIIEVETDYLKDPSSPYVITEEEFSSECLHYDKISAIYFADGTLTDEDEQIIDIKSSIGFDALDEFAKLKDYSDPIFVRNEKLGVDYVVTQNGLSYQEYILGETDDDPPDTKKRGKKEWTE